MAETTSNLKQVMAEQRKMLMRSMMAKRTPKAIQREVSQLGLRSPPVQTAAPADADDPGWATKTEVEVVTVSSD